MTCNWRRITQIIKGLQYCIVVFFAPIRSTVENNCCAIELYYLEKMMMWLVVDVRKENLSVKLDTSIQIDVKNISKMKNLMTMLPFLLTLRYG